MTIIWDAAYPGPNDPQLDGSLIYAGGDTPNPDNNPQTAAAYAAAHPGRYRLPTWVRSNPQQCDPHVDAKAFIAWLRSVGCPTGVATVLDLETAIDPAYVTAYGADLHAAGYLVLPYGSKSTLFQNPKLDGYFVSDPTGTDHIVVGSVATQFAFDGSYDKDDITSAVKLWDTQPEATMLTNCVGAARTPTGNGYWLVTATGKVYTHGDAVDHGSITGALNKPVCGIAATCSGNGYWLVAQDGGVFNFGDAGFFGSAASLKLKAPVNVIIPSPTDKGYTLVADDGGVFNFGDSKFEGAGA